jgi:hypothetical protein
MKERFSHELPRWMKLLGIWRINRDSIDFKWGYFAPRPAFNLELHRGGYFNQRYAVTIALGYGVLHVKLPFKTKLSEGCDMPHYGIAIHNDTFWIYKGGFYDESIGQVQDRNSSWSWYLPFFSYEFDGHWIQDKDREWVLMGNRRRKGPEPYKFRESGAAHTEAHPYKYTLKSGVVQERTATCTIEKRKWHRKWFPFLTRTSQVIDIEFSDEVGERSGSWKGGTIGCSYEMTPDDTIESCLRRMELERKF